MPKHSNKYRVLGICTDTIRHEGKIVPDKDGEKRYGAIGWYRIVNPISKLGGNVEIGLGVGVIPQKARELKALGDIWVCKMADNEDIDHIYFTLKELTGSKFVLDLDDDIDNTDPNHPDFKELEKKKHMRIRMVKMADHLIVATEKIKQAVKYLNSHITVIPNAIDPEIWNVTKPKKRTDGKIRIAWISSGSHFVDSPIIEQIMVELQQEYPQVEFHIAGMVNDTVGGKGWFHSRGTDGYKRFPQFYANMDADIAIAPLKDIGFNECKSNIKFLEAAMLEIPMVASDVLPYQCIKHGKTGYLASTPGQFKKYLKWLIENEAKRKEIGKEAKKYVLENWTIDKFLPKYKELFETLMEKKDITVVTAITGGKDDLKPQPTYKGVEYVAFTDKEGDGQWKVSKPSTKFADPVMNAKIHKILTHKYVSTPYIVWMDGSMTLKRDPHELIKLMDKSDMAVFKHPGRDCLYDEADACVHLGKGKIEEIAEQCQDYIKQEVPFKAGLCEMTAFIRKNTPEVNDLFEKWWVEVTRYSNRDQISFPKVFKEKNYSYIPGSVETDTTGENKAFPGNEFFKYTKHKL